MPWGTQPIRWNTQVSSVLAQSSLPTPLQSAVVDRIHIDDKSLGWREIWSLIPVSRWSLDAFIVPLCFVAKFQ